MQVGDIVKIVDWKGSTPDDRKHGTIVRVQGKHRWSAGIGADVRKEQLTEVLWQDGCTGWILSSRLGQITVK